MGLNQGTSGKGRIFLRIDGKEGRIYVSNKDEQGKWRSTQCGPEASIEGTVIDLATKEDSVNGQALTKGVLTLRDTEPNQPDLQVEFGLWRQNQGQSDASKGVTSNFGLKILALLNAADLNKPLVIKPWLMEAGAKMRDGAVRAKEGAGITFYQGGERLTPAFIEGGQVVTQLAPLPSQEFGGQVLYDKTGWDKVGQDLFASIESKLFPVEADAMSDHDEAIDPAAAAEAANTHPERQRA